ncbi:TPA: fimbrial biogenesis outer membrane usher protein [Salmonella enterica subsp. diarizonae]|nr:fimbrial biogenesis outer membrane usher protein [Salmonella enterica subsp. diarizonae]
MLFPISNQTTLSERKGCFRDNQMQGWMAMVAGCCLLVSIRAGATDFNLSVIDKDARSHVDLSWFRNPASVPPRRYLVSVAVNDTLLSEQQMLSWHETDTGSQVCIPPAMADRFELQPSVRQSLPDNNGCTDFSSRPDIQFNFDQPNQQLHIIVPQAWLMYHSKGWTPPSEWSDGIPGFLLDYNLFAGTYQSQGENRSDNANTYGTAGLNAGAWRLRSDFQYSSSRQGDDSTKGGSFSRTYLFRPLPDIDSRFVAGETNLQSGIFDTFDFTGISLNSDDRMLPWQLRGYAPQITGTARSNATVSVSQQGRVIYQTKVAPGPFVLRDLNQTVQGTLDVRITEDNGQVSTFQVSASTVPFLTRKGQVRYNVSAGQVRPDISHHTAGEVFTLGEASWGILSQTSLYGGFLGAGDHYQSLALGIGQNLLWLGAISVDVTRAASQLPDTSKQTGNSYRVMYSKRFDETDSQISVAALRHSDQHFLSYASYTDLKYGNDDDLEKQSVSVSGNQNIAALNLNLDISILRQTWWNKSASTTFNTTLGYTFDMGRFKGCTASISLSDTQHDDDEDEDRQIYFSLSLPFDNYHRLGYDLRHDKHASQSLSWNDSADLDNTWGISAGADSNAPHTEANFSANYQHLTSAGELQLSGGWQDADYRSVNGSWNGSLTVTPRGYAFHRKSVSNEPRLLVSTDGVKDIPINNGSGTTNAWGYAVIPVVTSYQPASISVDMNHLPEGASVDDAVLQATWTEGAIGYRHMASRSGLDIFGEVHTHDGVPPVGAEVMPEGGNTDIGMISDDGHLWLSGVKGGQHYHVRWSGSHQCSFTLPDNLAVSGSRLILPCNE